MGSSELKTFFSLLPLPHLWRHTTTGQVLEFVCMFTGGLRVRLCQTGALLSCCQSSSGLCLSIPWGPRSSSPSPFSTHCLFASVTTKKKKNTRRGDYISEFFFPFSHFSCVPRPRQSEEFIKVQFLIAVLQAW